MIAPYIYLGHTLIDITENKSKSVTLLATHQQKNLETFLQTIALRTNIIFYEVAPSMRSDLSLYDFGSFYSGQQQVWEFKFGVEYQDIYALGIDRYGMLKNDFRLVPIILGLTETISADLAMIFIDGPQKNLYFRSIDK